MSRYEQLLRALPRGSYYANEGYVLPYRDLPQEFLFEDAAAPNETYGIFVDDRFFGTVEANADGRVIVRVLLEAGSHEVAIENDTTARRLRASVTVRDYAVWYAAYAEALEGTSAFFGIDPAIDSVEAAPKLGQADSIHIEDVHGRLLRQPNDLDYINDSYRTALQNLRRAFRFGAARVSGVSEVPAAYTNSLAYVLPDRFRPRWYLWSQFMPNGEMDERTNLVTGYLGDLNITSQIAIGTLAATAGSMLVPSNPPTPQRIVVAFPSAWDGSEITVTGLDNAGNLGSEIFTNTGPVVGGFRTRVGTSVFATVATVTQTTTGTTGTARIGLSSSSFIRIAEVRGVNTLAGETTPTGEDILLLTESGGDLALSYGDSTTTANSNAVAIPSSGRYVVPYESTASRIVGLPFTSIAFNTTGRRYLWVSLNDADPVRVQLGVSGDTPADVVTDIENIISSVATEVSSTSGLTGDAVQLDGTKLKLFPGCGDASRELFGFPDNVGDSPGGAAAAATSLVYTSGDTLERLSAPFTARVGRGILQSGTGSVASAGTAFGTFTLASAASLDVGDCIEITSGANEGLHTVYAVVSTTVYELRHEDPASSFSTAGSQAYRAWSAGDLVEVIAHDTGTQTLTIEAPGLPRALPAGFQIELAGETPYVARDDNRLAEVEVVVDVDLSLAPPSAAATSNSLGVVTQVTPDNWRVVEGTSLLSKPWAKTTRTSLSIERGGSDIQIQANAPRAAQDLKGLPVTASFWVEQHQSADQDFRIDVSFDGASSFVLGTAQTVEPTIEIDGAARVNEPRPSLVQSSFTVPFSATTCLVRLTHLGDASGDRITIERCALTSDLTSGYYLDAGTILRVPDSLYLEDVVYIWSASDLNVIENTAIGIGAGNSGFGDTNEGKLDLVAPAHTRTLRFDVSEYSSTGAPLNVIGAYNDTGWLAATLVNLEVALGVPGRLSYARPTRLSQVSSEALTPDGSGVATLAQPTTHLGPYPQDPNGTLVLLKDGVPVPDTAPAGGNVPFVLSAVDTLDLDAAEYSAASTYSASYAVLMSAETAVLNLGDDFADYIWFVDAHVGRGVDQTVGTCVVSRSLNIEADFTAVLDPPSNLDKNATVVTRDDGVSREEVSFTDFDYVTQSRLRLDPGAFDPRALYSIEYSSVFSTLARTPGFTLQHRAAALAGDVLTETYADAVVDQPVDNSLRFHQLRIIITDVESLDQVRVHGLGLRGLRLFGSTPNAPGIILP